jgi:hypothetical protein
MDRRNSGVQGACVFVLQPSAQGCARGHEVGHCLLLTNDNVSFSVRVRMHVINCAQIILSNKSRVVFGTLSLKSLSFFHGFRKGD